MDYENIINFCEYSSRHQDGKYPNTWKPLDLRDRSKLHKGYNNWVKSVIIRDKVCQCCGLDKHLEAHHLFGYKENQDLATNINNGVTLCKFCHKKYHSIYGVKNINPVDFMNFIKKYGVR
jgi:replicative DNA helicase Mcm